MSNLDGLCGFYRDPNVGVNLAWSGEPGLDLNRGENPKVFGGKLQNITDTYSVLRGSRAHICKEPFSLNLAAG